MKPSKLGGVVEIVSGATPKTGIPDYWGGDIAWATPADLSTLDGPYISATTRTITGEGLRSCATTVLPVGSVLLSSRAPIGHVAINTVPMATNQGFKSLIPGPSIEAKYLFHWLKSRTDYLQGLGNGATFKELSKKTTEQIEIPLPPLAEQRRIAAILDQADSIRTKRRQVLAQLDALTGSAFRAAFGDVKETSRLGDLATTTSGGTPNRSVPSNYGGGIPWVKSGELHAGLVTETEETISAHGLSSSSAKVFPKGTVLLAMYGATAGVVGRLGIDAATNQAICAITPGPSLNADYLVSALRAQTTQLVAKAAGGAQPNLSQGIIRDIVVPVPSLEDQKRFADQAAAITAQRSAVVCAQRMDDALFTSLQSRAFRGEL